MPTLAMPIDAFAQRVREDFPILHQRVNGRPLVYFDNAATAQKPRAVIDALSRHYARDNANIHRGVHYLSQVSTDAFEAARDRVARWLNAAAREEVLFVRGATEAINLVAHGFARSVLQPGDEIVLSTMEHHANIVAWQVHAVSVGAELRVVPVTPEGELDLEVYARLLGPRTRLVALTHVSNTLGTINPARDLVRMAREHGVPVLLDGAQAVPHFQPDLQALGCDFYVFSAHKLFGPTGIGVLWMRKPWLDRLPPLLGGGDMIETVSFERTTFRGAPNKFEAGTPNIAGAIGLHAALDYLDSLDRGLLEAQEADLLAYGTERIGSIPGVTLVGTARAKVPVFSFTVKGAHPHDVGTILDARGIAVRAGHHCTQPLMRSLGIPGTSRASLAFYNTRAEIDVLADALPGIVELFS